MIRSGFHPLTLLERGHFQISNGDADQSQCRVTYRRGHATNLPVLAFGQGE